MQSQGNVLVITAILIGISNKSLAEVACGILLNGRRKRSVDLSCVALSSLLVRCGNSVSKTRKIKPQSERLKYTPLFIGHSVYAMLDLDKASGASTKQLKYYKYD